VDGDVTDLWRLKFQNCARELVGCFATGIGVEDRLVAIDISATDLQLVVGGLQRSSQLFGPVVSKREIVLNVGP
jgi:hypothetical protein